MVRGLEVLCAQHEVSGAQCALASHCSYAQTVTAPLQSAETGRLRGRLRGPSPLLQSLLLSIPASHCAITAFASYPTLEPLVIPVYMLYNQFLLPRFLTISDTHHATR